MSEPLSVVASAAGIISLGIQVTETIVLYCVSWKGYNKDIEDLNHKASGLSKTLKHLENVLQRQQNLDLSSRKQIEDLMDVSKITFDKLKEMTDKIPPPSTGSKAAFAKRALYPLRKQALVDAAGMLDSLQANIDTALSVLLLHQGTMAQSALSQDLHTRHSILQGQLAEQNAQLERMESMIRHLVDNRLQVAPSLLQSMQDQHRRTMAALQCSSCHTLGRRRAAPQQAQALEKKIQLQSRFLRLSVTLTLSITKGAGGCSIAPTLTYHGITTRIPESLIEGYFHGTPVLERDYVQCFRYLFERRIVRPFDRTTYGSTLLEEALWSMVAMTRRRSYEWEELFDPLRNVTRYLLEAGVPGDTSWDTLLDLLLRHSEAKNWSHPVISELIDAGSYITDKALTPFNRKRIQYFISYHPEAVYISSLARALVQEDEKTFARIVRQGQLSGNDIIGRYEAIQLAIGWPLGVKTLLEAGMDFIPPDTLIYATKSGCVSSLKLLLEAGIALTRLDVEYIVTSAENGEMDLLIDEIIFRRTKLRDLAIACLPEHKWRGIGFSHGSLPDLIAPKVYETLRDEGVDVPRRLCTLWYTRLRGPDGEIQVEKFGFSVFHLENLPVQYMQRLYDAGLTDVDEPDSNGLTPLMLKGVVLSPIEFYLWEALNPTPAQIFGRARWLVSKGADPCRLLPGTGVPTLHTVINTGFLSSASEISRRQSEASVNEPFADLDQHDLLFLRNAILENKPDACRCNCSTNGCTPLSISLKNLRRRYRRSSTIVLTTSQLLHVLPPSSTIMETVIRLMVFEDLDLTHTCCDANYFPRFDQNETKAIHEEEEKDLSELEQLVDEFMDLYNELNLPLLQFLQEHWCPRMQDYLQQEQRLSEDDLSKAREMGVDLSPSCPLRSDAWCVLLQPKITETEKLRQSDDSGP